MIELVRAAGELQTLCETEGWRFCFIGGLAVQRWGEPRETVDVDLTLLTGFGGEAPFIKRLLLEYAGRVDDPAEFARLHRVLLVRAPSGVGIDIALGALPFEESAVSRSSLYLFHQALLDELFHYAHQRLGDAVLAAQGDYAATGAFPELLSIYHLLGDPGLLLR